MALPTDKELRAARKSFRIIKREMKTLKALLDTLSGKVEADEDEAVAAAPNGHSTPVETVPQVVAQNLPSY